MAARQFFRLPVLARSKAVDLAVLAAPHEADGLGIELLARDLVPGQEVWTCGHPRGWPSADPPVLCRGVVAGVGEQHWANLEASWGNSGGALAFVQGDGGALVGGVALGKAGEAHADLDEYRKRVEVDLHVDPAVIADVEQMSEGMERINAKLRERIAVASAEGSSLPPERSKEEQARIDTVKEQLLRTAIDLNLKGTEVNLRAHLGEALFALTDFIDQHFRTGFVRFAPATAIRKLLGVG